MIRGLMTDEEWAIFAPLLTMPLSAWRASTQEPSAFVGFVLLGCIRAGQRSHALSPHSLPIHDARLRRCHVQMQARVALAGGGYQHALPSLLANASAAMLRRRRGPKQVVNAS